MNPKIPFLLAILFLGATKIQADWLLSDFATVTADSASTNTTYGLKSYGNAASTTNVTVPGGYACFQATVIASDPPSAPAGDGYSANVGVLIPLTTDWAPHDLTGLTGITFEYRNSDKITDYLAVSFGSAAYTDAVAKAGTTFEDAISGTVALDAGTTWKKATLDILDFAPPTWFTVNGIPLDYPTIGDVLKKVKNLQFTPKTTYTGDGINNGKACTSCTGPTMAKQTLDIRNITLGGWIIEPWPNSIVVDSKVPEVAISATYANGALNIKGFRGVKAMDVYRMDGAKVASFAPTSRVTLSLPRGTYFLMGRREGSSLVKSFTVLGR